MTDEEKLAEEYTRTNALKGLPYRQITQTYDEISGYPYFLEDKIKQAFLAGLKAGRTKWHKVADGDLPNTEREVLVFMWGSYYLGYYKPYDGEDSSWHFNDFDEKSEQIVAWCEIPQYKE